MRSSRVLTLAVIALALPAPAHAFDPTTGHVDLAESAVGVGFEGRDQFPDGITLSALSAFGQPLPDFAVEELFTPIGDAAIEGTGVLTLGGRTASAYLDLRPVAARFSGRRVEVKVWQRVQGTRAHLALAWYAAGADAVLAGEFFGGVEVGTLVFQPTGRITNDGWEEWTSGPVDADLSNIGLGLLRVFDEQIFGLQAGAFGYDGNLRVQLDALEIVDLGEAQVPRVSCTLADESTACGAQGVCLYGQCVDTAPVLGARIQNAELRRQYLERRVFELRFFEGGRFPLTQIDLFEPTLWEQVGEDATAKGFRTELNIAYQRLADGHASPPVTTFRPPGTNGGVCVHIGQADIAPRQGERPMVFSVAAGTPFADRLQPGDILAEIDGLEPDDWAPLARRYSRYSGDPSSRAFVTAPELFEAALLSGSTVTFERCTVTAEGRRCGPATVQRFDLDLASYTAGVFNERPAEWLQRGFQCDFRVNSAVPGSGDHDYTYAGVATQGGVRMLQINGVPQFGMQGGEAWFDAITNALGDGPDRVLLDHRLGSGGGIEAVDHLASYLVSTRDVYGMHLLPQLDREMTRVLRQHLLTCSRANGFTRACGSFIEWPLGGFSFSSPVARTARVAVLTGSDVSGNDFLTRLLTERSQGETRVFGGVRTYGAFGVVWQRPAFLGEIAGGTFQVHDTVFLEDRDDDNQDFTTGRGVAPDEVVLQSQRDAVLGVDTVLEAARAWVTQ